MLYQSNNTLLALLAVWFVLTVGVMFFGDTPEPEVADTACPPAASLGDGR